MRELVFYQITVSCGFLGWACTGARAVGQYHLRCLSVYGACGDAGGAARPCKTILFVLGTAQGALSAAMSRGIHQTVRRRSTPTAPRGVADFFHADVRSIVMVLWHFSQNLLNHYCWIVESNQDALRI